MSGLSTILVFLFAGFFLISVGARGTPSDAKNDCLLLGAIFVVFSVVMLVIEIVSINLGK